MLKINIVAIGKDKDAWVTSGCEHYLKLISRWAKVSFDILPALKGGSSLSPAEVMAQEADRFEKHLGDTKYIALGERGKRLDSHGFAELLSRWEQTSGGSVTLLIGGAYGLDDRLLKRADQTLSLSPMTFSHQLVRLVLLEQIYRGFSLLRGSPYHK